MSNAIKRPPEIRVNFILSLENIYPNLDYKNNILHVVII